MQNDFLETLVKTFKPSEKPVLIFCDFEDALKIEEQFRKGSIEAFYKLEEKPKIRAFSIIYAERTFHFVDQEQTKEFLELIN